MLSGCQQCQVVSLSRSRWELRERRARETIQCRSYEEQLKCLLCVIRRTYRTVLAAHCLSPRFKCPVMKSTETEAKTEPPRAPGPLPLAGSPDHRPRLAEQSKKTKRTVVCVELVSLPIRSSCCCHVCRLQHVAGVSCNIRATGFAAT